MSLNNASLTVGTTSYTVNGGSAVAFQSQGMAGPGSLTLVATADTDLRTRRSVDVKCKPPVVSVSAPNGYTQARTSYLIKVPKLLANGKITVNTAKVEFSFDVETTDAEKGILCDLAGQVSIDADFVPTTKLQIMA